MKKSGLKHSLCREHTHAHRKSHPQKQEKLCRHKNQGQKYSRMEEMVKFQKMPQQNKGEQGLIMVKVAGISMTLSVSGTRKSMRERVPGVQCKVWILQRETQFSWLLDGFG